MRTPPPRLPHRHTHARRQLWEREAALTRCLPPKPLCQLLVWHPQPPASTDGEVASLAAATRSPPRSTGASVPQKNALPRPGTSPRDACKVSSPVPGPSGSPARRTASHREPKPGPPQDPPKAEIQLLLPERGTLPLPHSHVVHSFGEGGISAAHGHSCGHKEEQPETEDD